MGKLRPIFTDHNKKSVQAELTVCAALKEVNHPTSIDDYKWAFRNLLWKYDSGNGIRLDHMYDFEIIDSLNAELWHKNIQGERDRKVISIQLERV